MPNVLLRLFAEGRIDRDRLSDRAYVTQTVQDNIDLINDNRLLVRMDVEFVQSAEEALQQDRPMVAVVLIATAVEQILNAFYLEWLEPPFDHDQVTEILRRNQLAAKIGWLMTLSTERELSVALKTRITNLFDTRNTIVHYKLVGPRMGDPPSEMSSHEQLCARVDNLIANDNLLRIPEELEQELDAILLEQIPEYALALQITEQILDSLDPGT